MDQMPSCATCAGTMRWSPSLYYCSSGCQEYSMAGKDDPDLLRMLIDANKHRDRLGGFPPSEPRPPTVPGWYSLLQHRARGDAA